MNPPKIDNAPGLTWRPRVKGRWVASWQARTDLVDRGFEPRSERLWSGIEPTETDQQFISDRCNQLQSTMLVWGRDLPIMATTFDGTLRKLIACYQTDKDSTYRDLRFHTRRNYDYRLGRLEEQYGDLPLVEINARTIKAWHKEWAEGGSKMPMAHGLITMLRTLATFGATFLDDPDCRNLKVLLHDMRFKQGGSRNKIITAEQVVAIRSTAHEMGWTSIALAQAMQFEGTLRQKDIIGEWVPMSEPGLSTTTSGNEKWIRGIRWEEIDANLILRHVTSKRGKEVVIDLKNAPMVLEEFRKIGDLPSSGPVIVAENTGYPYLAYEFRRIWRKVATVAGVPKDVFNMDTRAGAITEATDSGATLEDVRHAATHSNIAMTARYSRGAEQKVAGVMQLRTAHRNKPRT